MTTPDEMKAYIAKSFEEARREPLAAPPAANTDIDPESAHGRLLCRLGGFDPAAVRIVRLNQDGDASFTFKQPLKRIALAIKFSAEAALSRSEKGKP